MIAVSPFAARLDAGAANGDNPPLRSEIRSRPTNSKRARPAGVLPSGGVLRMGELKMFAVIRTGGKQYRVSVGDVVSLEKLDAEAGARVEFDDVLLIGDGTRSMIGSPAVPGAVVTADVLAQERGPKVLSFKRRRRKASSKRLRGHRQQLTRVQITGIAGDAAGPAPAAVEALDPIVGDTEPTEAKE